MTWPDFTYASLEHCVLIVHLFQIVSFESYLLTTQKRIFLKMYSTHTQEKSHGARVSSLTCFQKSAIQGFDSASVTVYGISFHCWRLKSLSLREENLFMKLYNLQPFRFFQLCVDWERNSTPIQFLNVKFSILDSQSHSNIDLIEYLMFRNWREGDVSSIERERSDLRSISLVTIERRRFLERFFFKIFLFVRETWLQFDILNLKFSILDSCPHSSLSEILRDWRLGDRE